MTAPPMPALLPSELTQADIDLAHRWLDHHGIIFVDADEDIQKVVHAAAKAAGVKRVPPVKTLRPTAKTPVELRSVLMMVGMCATNLINVMHNNDAGTDDITDDFVSGVALALRTMRAGVYAGE